MSVASRTEKKGHVCPPSNATHPRDRWETMFVYSFINKFTQLRSRVEGLDTPMDLERALLSEGPDEVLTRILQQFILNLRPQTRNLSGDQVSATVASVLGDYFKTSEQTVFWNDSLGMNVDPFLYHEGGFFTMDWDSKLKILRQFVELQLCHAPEIKNTIDRAWGVVHNKHKKKEGETAPPDPNDPNSQENLHLVPLGQDSQRKRYWVADDSPRVYVSTNPWRTTATFQAVASTREEYLALIEELKKSAPSEHKGGEKRSKLEQAHLALIKALESRIDAIDAEIARVSKARRKVEQRNMLLAQAEIRETRTRRQTRRPDYVYNDDADSEDDADEYKYQEDDEEDDDQIEVEDLYDFGTENSRTSNGRRSSTTTTRRQSSRAAAMQANKRESSEDPWSNWRGERRSNRLGAPSVAPTDGPRKRARTDDSTTSAYSVDGQSAVNPAGDSHGESNGLKNKTRGAAAVKATEVAVEQVAGRKKSKFWYYAVEPVNTPPGATVSSKGGGNGALSDINGHLRNGDAGPSDNGGNPLQESGSDAMNVDKTLEGSLSPTSSARS